MTVRDSADRGAGSVLVLALVAVVLALGLAAAAMGGAVVDRARAQVAADLAALAAGDALALALVVPGGDTAEPCRRAAMVAERNGARVAACQGEPDGVVVVQVERRSAAGTAHAAARAGPRWAWQDNLRRLPS